MERDIIFLTDKVTYNYFLKNKLDNVILHLNNNDGIYYNIQSENKIFLIFNNEIDFFSNASLESDEIIFTELDLLFWEEMLVNKQYLLDKVTSKNDLINALLSEENSEITSIHLDKVNPGYVFGGYDKSKQNYRLILNKKHVSRIKKIPTFDVTQFQKKSPIIILPMLWDLINSIGGKHLLDYRVFLENIETDFDANMFNLLLNNGRLLKYGNNGETSIFYAQFYDLKDIAINKTTISKKFPYLSYEKLEILFDYFSHNFFSFQYKQFVKNYAGYMENKIKIAFKIVNYLIFDDNSEFQGIISRIIEENFLISPCLIQNAPKDFPLNDYIIYDILPNVKGLNLKNPKFTVNLNEISINIETKSNNSNIKSKKKLTNTLKQLEILDKKIKEEEAIRNAEELIQEEEKEKELAKQKQVSKKIAKQQKIEEEAKRKAEIQYQTKMKQLARKIAYEAKEFVVKREVSKKRKEANHLIKMKELAKNLAFEAKIAFENRKAIKKEQNIIDNNSYCEIGSDEYIRRTKEWDLSKICPQIFCYPQEYITSLFTVSAPQSPSLITISEPQEKLWLFDLSTT